MKNQEVVIASYSLELARDIRFMLNAFEAEGRSTNELQNALNNLKSVAIDVLSEDDKKKFEKILYDVNLVELDKRPLMVSKGEKYLLDTKDGVVSAIDGFDKADYSSPQERKYVAEEILKAAGKHGIKVETDSSIYKAAKKVDMTYLTKYHDLDWAKGYFDVQRKAVK